MEMFIKDRSSEERLQSRQEHGEEVAARMKSCELMPTPILYPPGPL